ncbi:nucleotidyl transferase AbiEii/AbiGii toxin family protein [Candidatus Kaiserbacteria bacterium]|nr:nucleotidyl transferase AbiEii/AbiGii toxin family protein [Candidatus Kaiserbacteria bacterium]
MWLADSPWYLAGGTALTLVAGHRVSVDLDFFTSEKTFPVASIVSRMPSGWETDIAREDTIYGRMHGAQVSFISYPFFIPRMPMRQYGSIAVLAPADIAVMKIVAISQRGRKRDFVDLFWYATHYEPLKDILLRLPDQYPLIAHDYHHILKSLLYFTDAEEDPMPRLLFDGNWNEMKQYFRREVPPAARSFLHLT